MTEAQSRARRQQHIEELCAASIRALSGIPDLHFRGRRLHRGRRALPLYAPHLHPSQDSDDFASFRGAADGLALRLAHSDAQLHKRLCPTEPMARMLFELLEQFRSEACVPDSLPGVRHNLRHRFEAWSLAFHHAGGTESARGLLLYTVTQMCRARVMGEAVVEETEDMLEATRFALAADLGVALAGLRRSVADQAAYAEHALRIANHVASLLKGIGTDADDEAADDTAADTDPWDAFSLLLDQGDEIEDPVATAVSGRSLVLDAQQGAYRVFTTAYDREAKAAELTRPEQLKELRERLDLRVAGARVHLAHLARDLQALLAVPSRDGWDSAQEEGLIDGRRLAQLISSPAERRLFRTQRRLARPHCRVNVLIDCSGSMKEHSESVAVLVDLLARALDQIGVATEVLGFTTGAWNGGRAQRDWVRAGRPLHPGRLNEACHIVFKDADTPWRRARLGLAALLKTDLYREGIDGEALEWAVRRFATPSRDAHVNAEDFDQPTRRLVFVISDGSPMDSATSLANDPHYLDHHLRDVVATHERHDVEIYGIGVGLDLSPYYSRSQVLDLSSTVGSATLRDVLGMLGHGPRR
ncbi:MAG: cobalt chelatase [Burkholderiaceae bacterium]